MSVKRFGVSIAASDQEHDRVRRRQQHEQRTRSRRSARRAAVVPAAAPSLRRRTTRPRTPTAPRRAACRDRRLKRIVSSPLRASASRSARASATVLPPLPNGPCSFQRESAPRRPRAARSITPITLSSRPSARPGLLAVALAVGQVRGDDRRGEPHVQQVEGLRADGGDHESCAQVRPLDLGVVAQRVGLVAQRDRARSRARSRASTRRARSSRSARPAGSWCPAG